MPSVPYQFGFRAGKEIMQACGRLTDDVVQAFSTLTTGLGRSHWTSRPRMTQFGRWGCWKKWLAWG